jgi:DegV family protein with EDD domain
MSHIAIVTDSTVNLPSDCINHYPITVLPQTLILDNKSYADGIDIQPAEFYHLLENSKGNPSSSQISQQTFVETFRKLLSEYDEILAVLVSSKLSGTIQSAISAKQELDTDRIELVDSFSASLALGFQVMTAARAAANGLGLAEVRTLVERSKSHCGALFLVDTLEYLHRGGRIGGAARFIGTALNLKPILELRDGQVEGIDRVRTEKKAVDRLLLRFDERIRGKSPLRIGVIHAQAYDRAAEISDYVQSNYHPDELIFSEVTPVIGCHTGPGTVGITYMAGM